jgi:hypothetical protein
MDLSKASNRWIIIYIKIINLKAFRKIEYFLTINKYIFFVMTSQKNKTNEAFTATMNGDYKALLCLKEAGYDLKNAEGHGYSDM